MRTDGAVYHLFIARESGGGGVLLTAHLDIFDGAVLLLTQAQNKVASEIETSSGV